ncbi:MAG: hypothetical protein GSR81_00400 [Desulfurococcales archaeon]|nr:hypothetical protein [Desulfurococcales archaeon]
MSPKSYKIFFSGIFLYLVIGLLFSIIFVFESIYFSYQLNKEYDRILSLDKPHLIIGYTDSLNKTDDLRILNSIIELSNQYANDHLLDFYIKNGLIYGFHGVLDNESVIVLVPSKSLIFTTSSFNLGSICNATDCLIKLESNVSDNLTNIRYTHGNLSLVLGYKNLSVIIIENYDNKYTSTIYSAVRALGIAQNTYLYIGAHVDEFLTRYYYNKGNSTSPAVTIIMYAFNKETNNIPSSVNIIEGFKNELIRQLRSYNVNYVVVDLVTTSLKANLENSEFMLIYVEVILIVMTLFVLMYVFMIFSKTYVPRKQKIYKLFASYGYDITKLFDKLHIMTIISLIIMIITIYISNKVSPILDPDFKNIFNVQSILLGSIISMYIVGIDFELNKKLRGRYNKYNLKTKYLVIIILIIQIIIIKSIAASFIGEIIVNGYLYGILYSIVLFLILRSKTLNNILYKMSKITGYQGTALLVLIIFFSIISPVIGSYALTFGKQELVSEYVPLNVCQQGIIFSPSTSESIYNLTNYLKKMDLNEWYFVTYFLVKRVNNVNFITYVDSNEYISNPSPGMNITVKKASVKLPLIIVSDDLLDKLGYKNYDWVLFVSTSSRYRDKIYSAFNNTSELEVWLDYSDVIVPTEPIHFKINNLKIVDRGFPLWFFDENPHEYPILVYMARLDYSSDALVVRWSKFTKLNISEKYLITGKLGIIMNNSNTINKILEKYPLLLHGSYYVDCKLLEKNIQSILYVSLGSLVLPLVVFSGITMIIAIYLYKHELESIIKGKIKLLISQGYDSRSLIKEELISYVLGLLFIIVALILYIKNALPRFLSSELNIYLLLVIASLLIMTSSILVYHLRNISKFIREYMGEVE